MKALQIISAIILGVALACVIWTAAALEGEAISLWQGFGMAIVAGAVGWIGYKIGQTE